MGLLDSLVSFINGSHVTERRVLTLADLDAMMDAQASAPATYTGARITPEGSLTNGAVWRCVQLLADTTGALPLVTYRRLPGGGKERASGLPIYRILHDAPNPEMTAIDLRSALVGHLYLWGNAYCEIQRDGYLGKVMALWPLRPDRMTLARVGGNLVYDYRLPDGTERRFASESIWHLRLLASNGIQGYSPVSLARQTIGLSMATEEYGARWFGNGGRPSGILTHPGQLKPDARKNLKASWEEAHNGLGNAQRVAVLEEGVSWQAIGTPPEDAQFLETRSFQITEIARWFGVPPHLVGDVERSTSWGTGIEEQNLAFYTLTLMPLLRRIESSALQKLFTEAEQQTLFPEHLLDALLRPDTLKRSQALQVQFMNGAISQDEWREIENRNPLPDGLGKKFYYPANLLVVGEKPPEPEPPAEEPASEPEPSREARAASHRRRLANSYKPFFREALQRLVKREIVDVTKIVDKYLTRRALPEFDEALKAFYDSWPLTVAEGLRGITDSYSVLVNADAAEEIGQEANLTPELQEFVRSYLFEAGVEWSYSSQGQMRALATEQDALTAIMARLAEWGEKKADKEASQQTVELANALASETWITHGVQEARWVAHGENCPYCSRLNGQKRRLRSAYVDQGKDFHGFTPSRAVKHGPLHSGCDCSLIPLTG